MSISSLNVNICLIAMMLVLLVIIIGESKDFCREFLNNGHKIDFAFRYIESRHNVDTEYRKYFFIGNTYWKLTYIDGTDKTVTIDDESTGQSDWLSGKNYSMVWCFWFLADHSPRVPGVHNEHCRVAAVKKNLKTIDWGVLTGTDLMLKGTGNSTNIRFDLDFKPTFVWHSVVLQFNNYRFATFWSNGAPITEEKTKVYNFVVIETPANKHIPRFINKTGRNIITGKIEQQLDIELIGIVGQFSTYDYNYGTLETGFNGQGSIVFTNVNDIIKYCYVGQPFNETACKPEHMKTLINCLVKPSLSVTMIIIKILVVVAVLLMISIVGLIILINKYVRHGGRGRRQSVSGLQSSRPAMSKQTKQSIVVLANP